jgi:predicted nicotinamide N-methyase
VSALAEAAAHLWWLATGLASLLMLLTWAESGWPRRATRLARILLASGWLGLVWATAVGLARVVL